MKSVRDWRPYAKVAVHALYRDARLYWSNRSLRAWGRLVSYVFRRMTDRSLPHFATIAPTYRCQCRCSHCFSDAGGRRAEEELTTEELKRVIDQAKELGVLHAIFTGGEPLLRENIVELVAHAHKAGLITRLSTNGILLTRDMVARLKQAGLTQCGVSIDDPDPKIHDRLRGIPGTFAKAIEGIRHLRRSNLKCRILTYASHRTISDRLEEIIALGRRLKVMSVQIRFPVASGRWDGAYHEVLSEEEKARTRALQDMSFVYCEQPTPRSICCLCSKALFHVTPSGEVTPCGFVPYVLGSLREEPLADIWHRHVSRLRLKWRDDCPMNNVAAREALRAHVQSARPGRLPSDVQASRIDSELS